MADKRCPLCGCHLTPSRRTKDHLIPKAFGGDGSYLNTWTICKRCNNAKGQRLPNEREILAFCRAKEIPNIEPHTPAIAQLWDATLKGTKP